MPTRLEEIDQLIVELYGNIHDAIMSTENGYSVFGIVDKYVEQIAQLKVERAWLENNNKKFKV